MDSNRLRYFLILNETGSIRKAAEHLHLSPAALSKAIKQLEHEAGFTLLVPAGRGILITDEGRELATRAKPLLDGLESLKKGMIEDHRRLGLRIGSFEVFTTYFLREIFDNIPLQNEMIIRELVPGDMEKALLDKHVDYGITYIPIPTNGIEHHKIANFDMAIFGTKEFLSQWNGQDISKVPFVVPIPPLSGSPNKVQGLDGWPDDKIHRNVHFRVTLMESALEICRKDLAVAYLPSFVARLHNDSVKPKHQLVAHQYPRGLGTHKQDIYLSRRKTDAEDDIFKKLAKAIRLAVK